MYISECNVVVPNSLNTEQNRFEFHISIDEAVNIELKFDLFRFLGRTFFASFSSCI